MHRQALALAFLISLFITPLAEAAAISPIGTNQRTLVICVRYSDALTTRMANCSDWVTLLNTQINTYYNQATFNQTNFQFETISGAGAPANGWLDLGYAGAMYTYCRVGQDAITLADPFVNFANYNRVLVITSWPGFGGQGGGPYAWAVGEGAEGTASTCYDGSGPVAPFRLMTLANVNEWVAGAGFDFGGAVMAHELGHQLGAPTHYGDIFSGTGVRDTISWWDLMGFSPTLHHFLGYPKMERGWIPTGPRIVTVGPPTGSAIDQTITLRPLEQTTTGAQLIRIPFTSGSPFVGYMIENRRQINGDERLASQGVLLTAIDESPHSPFRAFVVEDPGNPMDLDQAPLEVGDIYSDAARNLTVRVLSQSGDNYDVRVQYAPPATTFDPAITPWGAPPWETADIWIDSQRNMFGTYLYTDAMGNPTGNGDDAWVDHDNRVYVRVRNNGTGAATNVRVQVFVNSPPGMGDAGPNWDFLGNILIPTVPGLGEARGFVMWRPTVGAHTCIKAVIINTPGELSTANNLAQENVSQFDTSMGSPYEPVHLEASVFNPFDVDLPIRMHVRDIPYGWAVITEPTEMVVAPRGRHPVHVTVYPSGFPPHEPDGSPSTAARANRPECPPAVKWDPGKLRETMQIGFLGKPKVEAHMPFYDTFIPIGGIDVWTHLVRETRLTCHVAGTKHTTDNTETAVRDALKGPKPPAASRGPKDTKPQYVDPKRPRIGPESIQAMFPLVRHPEPDPVVARPVTIEGQLTPAIEGAVIAVDVRDGDRRRVEFAKTDANGNYRITIDNVSGLTVVQSSFAGDLKHGESESGFCRFIVKGN